MKKRVWRFSLLSLLLLLLGLGYYVLCKISGTGLPCIFHKITGLYCPGCGISRMFISLFSGDIAGAASSNVAVFILLPVFCAVAAYGFYRYLRYGERAYALWQKVLLYLSLVILILFGIARNLFPYDILIP